MKQNALENISNQNKIPENLINQQNSPIVLKSVQKKDFLTINL